MDDQRLDGCGLNYIFGLRYSLDSPVMVVLCSLYISCNQKMYWRVNTSYYYYQITGKTITNSVEATEGRSNRSKSIRNNRLVSSQRQRT